MAVFPADTCSNISGTGSYAYAVTIVEDSYLPAVSLLLQLFVRQTHMLPTTHRSVVKLNREQLCSILSFSASNFTNHWSNNWRTCASSSNRRWIEVLSDGNLVSNGVHKHVTLITNWSRASMIFPSCIFAVIRLYMLLSFIMLYVQFSKSTCPDLSNSQWFAHIQGQLTTICYS